MHCKSYSHFFSKKIQNICVSLDVIFNESLTNDIVSFEQLGPGFFYITIHVSYSMRNIAVCGIKMLVELSDHGTVSKE